MYPLIDSKILIGLMSKHIWTPELHYIDGKWYIYFAAGREDEPFAIRMYVLENEAENPLEQTWVEKGAIETRWDSFSLDATTFEHEGVQYLVWAPCRARAIAFKPDREVFALACRNTEARSLGTMMQGRVASP